MTFKDCDLSNNDFSGLYLDPKGAEDQPDRILFTNGPLIIENCNLANTGIKIGYNYDKLDFNPLIEKGYFDGCIFHGTKIKSKEEQEKEAKDLLKKYNTFKSNRINKVLDLIDDQLNHAGGRQVSKPKSKTLNLKEFDHDTENFYGNI